MNIKQPQYTFSALALAVVVGLSGPALAQSAAGSSPGCCSTLCRIQGGTATGR
nr:hypothetical protein HT591_01490 [Klebsiella pneumoniae]